jgi:hypothetical protein
VVKGGGGDGALDYSSGTLQLRLSYTASGALDYKHRLTEQR